MLHLLAEYRISEHYPCSCRLDMADSRRLGLRTGPSGSSLTTTTLRRPGPRDVYGGKMHARLRDIYRLPRVGSLSKSSRQTLILKSCTAWSGRVCPHRADAPRSAGSCPRHLITGRRNLSRLHLERRGHTLDEQGWCGADAVSARDLARDLKGQPRALQRQPWHQEHAFRFNRP